MAKIPGTNVASTIAPFTTDDQFPTHDAIYGKGGQREVATIAERDAIPTARLTEGCTCYVAATEKTYRWKSNTWVDDTPEIVSDASDISYTPSGSSTQTTVAGALDSLNESVSGLESSVEDNADDIADLQEGAVAVDVDTTTKVFAIKNINNVTVGSITLGTNATNGAAELTFVAGSDSFVASLPNLAYDSSNQMLKMVEANGTQTNLIKLSNLQIKGVGSTLPCWDTTATPDPVSREAKVATGAPHWAIGDLFLRENSSTTPSTFDLCVCTDVVDDGTYYNYSWENIGSINNVSLQADQVEFDNSTNGFEATDVQGAIEEVNDKVGNLEANFDGGILDLITGKEAHTDSYYVAIQGYLSLREGSGKYFDAIDISEYVGEELTLTIGATAGGERCVIITRANDSTLIVKNQSDFYAAEDNKIVVTIPNDAKYLYVSCQAGTTVIKAETITDSTIVKRSELDAILSNRLSTLDGNSSTIQLKRNTAANWTSANPVLQNGEIGVETDTNKIKIGDGSTAWSSLEYFGVDEETLEEISEQYAMLDASINGGSIDLLAGEDALSGKYYVAIRGYVSLTGESGTYFEPIDIADYRGKELALTIGGMTSGGERCVCITKADGYVQIKKTQSDFYSATDNKITVTVPNDAKYLYVSCPNSANVRKAETTIESDVVKRSELDAITNENKTVYVSPNGSDTNNGYSETYPVATIQKALQLSRSVKLLDGVYTQSTIDLSLVPFNSFSIFTDSTKRPILFGGTKILESDGTTDSTYNNVKVAQIANFTDEYNWIYQYGVLDSQTLINIADIHPLHKRRSYRCEHTTLTRMLSIQEVSESEVPAFFYDNGSLYYKAPQEVNSTNFLFVPNGVLFTNTNGRKIEMNGLTIVGKALKLDYTFNSKITNCSVGYCHLSSSISAHDCQGLVLDRCEALRSEYGVGDTIGDGFGFNTASVTNILANNTTFTLLDCWAHDNFNDGYSDHVGCQGIIRGGLFEYNCLGGHGAGITPALGASDCIYGALCQHNKYDGVQYHGSGSDQQGNTRGWLYMEGVVSRYNDNNGFACTSASNSVDFVNCIAYNNGNYGFYHYSSQNMRVINCKATGNTTKDISDGCIKILS